MDKSGLLEVQGIIFDNTVKLCMETLESGSSKPEIKQFKLSSFKDLHFIVTSLSRDKASTLLTQSPVDRFSLIDSIGLFFTRPRMTGAFTETSEPFANFKRGLSCSGLDKQSFNEA